MLETRRMAAMGASMVLVGLLVGGCLGDPAIGLLDPPIANLPPYGGIGPQQAREVISQLQDDPMFVLLDIRTPAEVAAGHLPGAINLDFRAEGFHDALDRLDREAIYVIYCRTANRTGQAFSMMLQMGFGRVYDLQGGIQQWMALEYPVCVGDLSAEHVCVDM